MVIDRAIRASAPIAPLVEMPTGVSADSIARMVRAGRFDRALDQLRRSEICATGCRVVLAAIDQRAREIVGGI